MRSRYAEPKRDLLRGVKHLQDSEEGTRTELNLCIPRGIGSGLQVNIGNGIPGT